MSTVSDEEFLAAVERYRGELRLHCYRMLGSSLDSDDVLQETLVRAWRARSSLSGAGSARAWLYRIASNVCIDELARRRRRALAYEAGPATNDAFATIAVVEREAWVEPCPDAWLTDVVQDPASRYQAYEGVALAFIAALQHLTAVQRATLLLRDVTGLSAEETARALGLTLEAANSALFRARSSVTAKLSGHDPAEFAQQRSASDALLERYVKAWKDADAEAFVALLHEEVRTTMPPSPLWLAGRTTNAAFYRRMFAERPRDAVVALLTAANGQQAFGFYRASSPQERHLARAIQLVNVRAGAIVSIDHFMLPELFPLFGLPSEIASAAE